MAYIFHNGKFIKGKVQQGSICDDEDIHGNPAKVKYSRFVDESGTAIITSYSKTFCHPVGRTKRSLWKKTIETNNADVEKATSVLSNLIDACAKRNKEITEELIRDK